ncbi:MAG TPA: hypothetical protein VNE86_06570 [Nitrososphaerales archaeon]|nr:hypothetical protein [Nitrososphaerales archaeon]
MSLHPYKVTKSTCHLFHVGYRNGRDNWIAFDMRSLSDLTISAMKKKITKSEKSRNSSADEPIVWYVGKLALWKQL